MDTSAGLTGESNGQNQYQQIQDFKQDVRYGQYSRECTSLNYMQKSPVPVSRAGLPHCSYRAEITPCTLNRQPVPLNAHDHDHDISVRVENDLHTGTVPTIQYIQSEQYDELSEYGLTTPCAMESHYVDDPGIAYGYASEVSYGIHTDHIDSVASRPHVIYDDNLNGAGNLLAGEVNLHTVYDDHNDFQQKMSQLTLSSIEIDCPINEVVTKKELLDCSSSDICIQTRWRDPNFSEVVKFLNNPNNTIKANAAAYLQHLCYMDDPNKQRTRTLGGIPPLINLLSYDIAEIQKNACGALRNLSYGRQHDENKRAIKHSGGITALVDLLDRTQESEVKELVTGILWNMSSCEDIKRSIIDESLSALVANIIRPHSGYDAINPGDTCFSLSFRNASGVLRNVSSAGEYARSSLRHAHSLVDCLLYILKKSIEKNNIGNKTVENCVCILRNLSYRCQEVEDPNYDKQTTIVAHRSPRSSTQGENLGCFGASKKKKEYNQQQEQELNSVPISGSSKTLASSGSLKGYEQLWQSAVVQPYLALLQSCSNPETLEAAAGAIQNLSACYWQPSIDIRATVRKEKGLPILVELLRMEVDRVVCAVATALRNLAIDQRNKELIGKYAMRDLVQKLPSGNLQHDQTTSDDTISAVLATINEVIKRNPEFSRSLLDAGGVDRLMNITQNRKKFSPCVLKFCSQVLFTMWQHYDLREVYKKNGWKEQDFVTKSTAGHNSAPNSPNNANNTLNRPMASQGRTKYEDRTIQRTSNISRNNERATTVSIYNNQQSVCRMEAANSGESDECGIQHNAVQPGLYLPMNSRNDSK